MNYIVKHRSFDFNFPASEPPSWAGQVERWYQLDAFAFGLPQAAAYWGLSTHLKSSMVPTHLVLASPEGSNRTDFDFARSFLKTGTGSPSKFVHTLPNSRSAALLQVLGWYGPLLCLQNDPSSIVEALMGAVDLLRAAPNSGDQSRSGVWVFAVTRKDDAHFTTHLFEIHSVGAGATAGHASMAAIMGTSSSDASQGAFSGAVSDGSPLFIQSSATAQRLTHISQLEDTALLQWLYQARASAPSLALNSKFQISTQYIGERISESNSELNSESFLDSQRTRT